MSEHDIILCFVEWLVPFDYLTTNKSLTKVHGKPSKRRTMPNENSSPDLLDCSHRIIVPTSWSNRNEFKLSEVYEHEKSNKTNEK